MGHVRKQTNEQTKTKKLQDNELYAFLLISYLGSWWSWETQEDHLSAGLLPEQLAIISCFLASLLLWHSKL